MGPVPEVKDTPASAEEITYWSDRDISEGVGPWSGHAPFDLRNVSNSHTSCKWQPPRGLKGITGHGRKMVRSAGAIIKRRYPRHRVTFGTVTFPTMTRQQRRLLAQRWSELLREYQQWLTRRLLRAEQPPIVVSVSEIQPGRLQDSGQACLHLHSIWLNRPGKAGGWSIDPNDLRSWVSAWLKRNIDGFDGGHVNVDVRPVKASIAAYMSKYMSKGGDELLEAVRDWGSDACPHTWYNLTAAIRNAVKDELLSGEFVGEFLSHLVDQVFIAGDMSPFHWLRQVELDLGGALVTVGWRGCLREGHYLQAVSALQGHP